MSKAQGTAIIKDAKCTHPKPFQLFEANKMIPVKNLRTLQSLAVAKMDEMLIADKEIGNMLIQQRIAELQGAINEVEKELNNRLSNYDLIKKVQFEYENVGMVSSVKLYKKHTGESLMVSKREVDKMAADMDWVRKT